MAEIVVAIEVSFPIWMKPTIWLLIRIMKTAQFFGWKPEQDQIGAIAEGFGTVFASFAKAKAVIK